MIKAFLTATSTTLELDAIGFSLVAIVNKDRVPAIRDNKKTKHLVFSYWGGERKQSNTLKVALKALTNGLKEMTNEFLVGVEDKEIRLYSDYPQLVSGTCKFETYNEMVKATNSRAKKELYEDWKRFYGVKQSLIEMGFTFRAYAPTANTDVNEYDPYCDALAGRGITNTWLGDKVSCTKSLTLTDDKMKETKGGRVSGLLKDKYLYLRCGEGDEITQQKNVYYLGSGSFYKNDKMAKVVKGAPTTMYIGHLADVRYLGRPSANDRCSVVILNKPDEYINKIWAYQDKVIDKLYGYDHLVVVDTGIATKPRVKGAVETIGVEALGVSMKGALLNTNLERLELSHVFHPPRNAFLLNNRFDFVEAELRKIMAGTSDWTLNDVRATLVGFTKAALTSAEKVIKVPVKVKMDDKEREVKIKMIMGKDLPEYTWMQSYPKQTLNAYVVTRQTGAHSFEFAFVLEHKEGWMFWQCPQGSVHWLPSIAKK